MQLNEAVNRGKNLLATAIVALSAFAFLPEIFIESEGPNKLDEGILFVLGIIAIGWYLKGTNKFKRSVVPVVLVVLSLCTKIMALFLEHSDPEDLGDDMGALILFILATILVVWQYNKKEQLI